MARAALLLDGIALQDPAKRGRIVELGAIPLLLQAIAPPNYLLLTTSCFLLKTYYYSLLTAYNLLLLQAIARAADALTADALAAAPQAAALLNCLGLLEGLAQGSKPVQELARKQVTCTSTTNPDPNPDPNLNSTPTPNLTLTLTLTRVRCRYSCVRSASRCGSRGVDPKRAHSRRPSCGTNPNPNSTPNPNPNEVATQRAPGVGVCVSTLRDRLAAARGLTQPTQLDDLEALACCSFMVRVMANPNPNPNPTP